MCTAISYKTKDFYVGRTLDYEHSYSEEVTITPRRFPLRFREMGTLESHYAIIGMARAAEGYPLYFDAFNEKGLAIAALNFVGYAHYGESVTGRDNIAHFELIPWILAQCTRVAEAKVLLERMNLTNTPFSEKLPPAELHWFLADRKEAAVVEATRDGLRMYPNPVGVLTNNPPFPEQVLQLNNFMHLSAGEPHNHFSDKLDLRPYSRGMGALGLPGDLSSQSRFVRAAFTKLNSVSGSSEAESVSQFFHILGAVSQTRGCCIVGEGEYERTIYTSCGNVDKGVYYYTTYDNQRITAVGLHRENLDDCLLRRYPLICSEEFRMQN